MSQSQRLSCFWCVCWMRFCSSLVMMFIKRVIVLELLIKAVIILAIILRLFGLLFVLTFLQKQKVSFLGVI